MIVNSYTMKSCTKYLIQVRELKSYTLTLIFSLSILIGLTAQPISKPKYDVLVEHGMELEARKDYNAALKVFEEAYDEKKDTLLVPRIANLQYQLRFYKKAERWLDRLLSRDKYNQYGDYRYAYGRVLKMTEQYPEAIAELERFIDETDNDSLATLAKTEILGAQMAMDMPEATNSVEVINAGRDVNRFSIYSPALGRDAKELYFAALEGKGEIEISDDNKDYHAKIYRSVKEEDGWSKPSALGPEVNRPGVHSSKVTLSPDGNTMFITRSVLEGNELVDSRVYYSSGGEGQWKGAQELEGINGDYLVKDPAVGELFGREVLFFSSNMDGGEGGFDLYYATREGEGKYSLPVNLGEGINTIADDETPFYFDGTLYFSSNGQPTIGGFDLFYTVWDGTKWSQPTNMGAGFNTSYDDQGLFMSSDGYNGFLASNRVEGRSSRGSDCCNDAYMFEIARLYADLVVGVFDDKKQVLKGGTVEVIQVQNNVDGKMESKTNGEGNRFDFGLELEMPYKIVASREGYFPDSITLNTVGLKESKTFQERFFLKKMPELPKEPLYDTILIEEAFVLENILYDLDDDRIKPEAEPDLLAIYDLMTKYPDMKIELRSHTDFRGEDNYNEDLAQRRANSARRWLIRKGIDRDRMDATGYGEKVPQTVTKKMASQYDFLPEGQVLTEPYIRSMTDNNQKNIAHSINRRTEFKITEGPTSVVIERKRVLKNDVNKAPKRNALPKEEKPLRLYNTQSNKPIQTRSSVKIKSVQPDTSKVNIHKLSSLHGKKNLKGLPIMTFKERLIDFGKVPKGEKRYHTYEFTNTGDTDLIISSTLACECTTVDATVDKRYKPGDSGTIDVTFDSTEKDGFEVITIDLFLDNTDPDTGNPIIEKIQYQFDVVK